MAEQRIPDDHHVVRHCPRGHSIRENGKVTGVYPEFFKLRAEVGLSKTPETYLSASYYEYFGGAADDRMLRCLEATPRDIADSEAMVRLGVGLMLAQAKATKKKVRVSHIGNKKNPAYAKITGTGQPGILDEELAALLSAKSIVEIAMAGDIRRKVIKDLGADKAEKDSEADKAKKDPT